MTKNTEKFEPSDADWEHVKNRWSGYGKTWRLALEQCAKGKLTGGDAADDLYDARKDAGRSGPSDVLFIKLAARVLWARQRIRNPLQSESEATQAVKELLAPWARPSTVAGYLL
jgi:hypothetical protein